MPAKPQSYGRLTTSRLIVADLRQVLVHVGAEVAQADQRLAAGVFDLDAGRGRLVRDEHFVLGLLAEVDHGRRLQGELADAAAALHRDPAAGAGVLQRALRAGLDASVPWR